MASAEDVCDRISSDLGPIFVEQAGKSYPLPRSQDRTRYGSPQTVPDIICAPGHSLLRSLQDRLEADLGKCTVWEDENELRARQFQRERGVLPSKNSPLVTATETSFNSWAISGGVQVGDTIGVQYGSIGAGYAVQTGDSFASIAAGLAANAVSAGIPATALSNQFTVNSYLSAVVNTGATDDVLFIQWRREKMFNADLLVAKRFHRQYLGRFMEALYGRASGNLNLALYDGTLAQVIGMQSITFDDNQKDDFYLLRVRWHIAFTTVISQAYPDIVATTLNLDVVAPPSVPPTLTPPLASQL